jgi:hypothetical protein
VSLIYITKVVDEKGNILRYEDEKGIILAKNEEDSIFNTEKISITKEGIESGYMLINGKIVKRK